MCFRLLPAGRPSHSGHARRASFHAPPHGSAGRATPPGQGPCAQCGLCVTGGVPGGGPGPAFEGSGKWCQVRHSTVTLKSRTTSREQAHRKSCAYGKARQCFLNNQWRVSQGGQ